MNPAGCPEDYADTEYDLTWARNDDGTRNCYVEATEYDQSVLADVRAEFDDDEAIYLMAKQLDSYTGRRND